MNRTVVHSSEMCVKAVCFIPASPFAVPSDYILQCCIPKFVYLHTPTGREIYVDQGTHRKTNTHKDRMGLNGL